MSTLTTTLAQMNFPTRVTLAAGYALAVPPFLAIVPALRNPVGRTRFLGIPHRLVLASALFGAGCVTSAWFAAGYRAQNAVNVGWLVACTTIWLRSENKLRLQQGGTETD
ncbi:MAG: hypothetical protein M3176_12275 [Chloroflexota bacterium]|nr:hypothetical protein [Chloroflexota bacterium]MDQ6907596.1 hypothetical protein [Chloroflexota bacterium]